MLNLIAVATAVGTTVAGPLAAVQILAAARQRFHIRQHVAVGGPHVRMDLLGGGVEVRSSDGSTLASWDIGPRNPQAREACEAELAARSWQVLSPWRGMGPCRIAYVTHAPAAPAFLGPLETLRWPSRQTHARLKRLKDA
jgi:hypothetical protein